MKRQHLIQTAAIVALVASSLAAAPVTESLPVSDVVFRAMADELGRSMKDLALEDLDKPYFVQYAVEDTVIYHMQASYGAIVSSSRDRSRDFTGITRVGSYELDNTHFVSGGGGPFGGSRGGTGARATLPLDDDYLALRQAMWRATDRDYKRAVETLTKKRAHLKNKTIEDRPNDFTPAEAVTAIEPPATFEFDKGAWEDNLKTLSARFKDHPQIQDAEVMLVAAGGNRYIVNSEGTRLATKDTGCFLQISAETQADDGMKVSDDVSYAAEHAGELPPIAKIESDIDALVKRLVAIRSAPVLESFSGPVVFDGKAAPQMLAALLAPGLAGKPDPIGSQPKMPGGAESLETKLGKRILPKTFQAYDDPAVEKHDGKKLWGHYRYDDEGIPARKVSLIEGGKLVDMCMSRSPNKKLSGSNGHGRAAPGAAEAEASIASLFITCDDGVSAEELKAQLIEACKDADVEFGLRIAALKPGGINESNFLSFFRRMQSGSAPSAVPAPLYAYKVYAEDGREELVRGLEFAPIQVRSLKKVLAAGKDTTVYNRVLEADLEGPKPPSSVIAPPVLFEDLELAKIEEEFDKPPILKAPAGRGEDKKKG